MNMTSFFQQLFRTKKVAQERRIVRQVIDLLRQTESMTSHDLADWREAWRSAINIEHPDRTKLYRIYRDVLIDLHLSGCIDQRKGFALARSFMLVDEEGTRNKDAERLFDNTWFKSLMSHIIDSIYWGHSLIELGDVIIRDGKAVEYDGVTLIPRAHVIPEYHVFVRHQLDSPSAGVNYHEDPYSQWLIEAGDSDSLGLLLKAATQTIPKKNMLAFWDTFGEIFGMPMRIAKTSSRDQSYINEINDTLANMGAALSAVLPQDTEIQVVENAKSDAFNVYDRRIDRANSELSKLILGQTMTIEDGSSLSQSQTHLTVFRNLIEKDCDMIRDIINNQLLPRMVRHGFDVAGLTFEWDYAIDYTPEQQLAYETMISDRYEVPPSYFEEKYGIPVGPSKSLPMADDKTPTLIKNIFG
ncbi:MAG: DUF935 family protein [Marinilabiliaceae bacterium]|nr:DUF935 family protein [Marinilabiliaceae bacterium]